MQWSITAEMTVTFLKWNIEVKRLLMEQQCKLLLQDVDHGSLALPGDPENSSVSSLFPAGTISGGFIDTNSEALEKRLPLI